jgi:hypothetical protein
MGKETKFEELHRLRYFFLPDLTERLSHHGFEVVCAEEWLTGNPPSPATWGVCVAAVRVEGN